MWTRLKFRTVSRRSVSFDTSTNPDSPVGEPAAMLPAPSGLYANSSCVRGRDGLEAFYTTLHKGFLIHSPPAQDDFHPKEHELHPE